MIYRSLNNGKLDLVIREIPSIHLDGDGRSIPCAVQFIGEADDRKILDYMAVDIANDINKFHEFFSNLFSVRGGLHIEGDKLRKWIDEHNVPFITNGSVSQINNISSIKSGVFLFVPLSNNFGIDETVTQNVSSELNLPIQQMKEDNNIIHNSTLIQVQHKTDIMTGVILEHAQTEIPSKTTVSELEEIIIKKDEEILTIKTDKDEYFKKILANRKEIELLKNENRKLADNLVNNTNFLKISYCVITVLAIYSLYSLIFK